MRVIVKPGGHHNYISVSDREGSLTYLHGGNPSSQSVPSLQEFEVSEAILSQVTGGRQSSDASSDDDELMVVLQLLLRLRDSSHLVGESEEVLSVVVAVIFLVFS